MSRRNLGYGCCLGLIAIYILGCGGSDNSESRNSVDGSATLTVQLNFPPSAAPSSKKSLYDRALGEPDICKDYHIDHIDVRVYRSQDKGEVASAQSDCSDHSLTVDKVPAGETLFVVCTGSAGEQTVWQGQKDDIVVSAGRNTDIGIIDMAYSGTDTAAPVILSSYPTADSTDVDLSAWILFTFNEPLAISSIPDNSITLLADGVPVAGLVSYDPAIYGIRFIPATELAPNTIYTAAFQSQGPDGGMISDIARQPFIGSAQWQFTTRGATDTIAPKVIAVSPANNAVDVDQQTTVTVHFNESMNPATITDGVFQLSSDQGVVNGMLLYNDKTRILSFTPEISLNAAILYEAVVSTQARDAAQNALQEPYKWQFKTMGPKFDLVVSKNDSGAGTVVSTPDGINCGSVCQANFDLNTSVTLSATPDENSTFTGWSGDVCEGTTDPCTFHIAADTNVTANFSFRTYTINLSVTPSDGSSGAITPTAVTVTHGEEQTVEINANPYYQLSELRVDGNPVTPTSTYHFENVISDHTIEAVFETNTIMLFDNNTLSVWTPQINEKGYVVWAGKMESGMDIFFYDGSIPPNPINISKDDVHYSRSPQINAGGRIVWTGSDGMGDDIWYFDAPTAPYPIRMYHNTDGGDRFPQLNIKMQHVWYAQNASSHDIHFFDEYNITGETKIYESAFDGDLRPQINGNGVVVWSASNGTDLEIFLWDATHPQEPKNISKNSAGDDRYPQINARGQVVWSGYDGSDYEIYLFDSSISPDPINISKMPGFLDTDPQINDAGHVVWSGGGVFHEIYYHDGSIPSKPVNISKTPEDEDRNPQINNSGRVVWSGASDGGDWEIFYYDESISPNTINISNNSSYKDQGPMINDDGRVVWLGTDRSNGNTLEATKVLMNCVNQCTAVNVE